MRFLTATSFCLTLFAHVAGASQIIEGFDNRTHFDFGTAVWNQELGKIHPTLRVMNYTGAAATGLDFSVGDGSDGPFDITTYAAFSVGGNVSGQIIRLDTTVHPVLNVTHFSLASGWTLQPVGNGQLIIHSLSFVDIQGVIACSGDNGGNGSGVTGGTAGAGHCGGANGGAGGSAGAGGNNGSNADPSVTGGQGGNFSAGASVGGGGGGSWNTTITAQDGPNFSGAGGTHGTSFADPSFSSPLGSSGGGGGGGVVANGGGGGGGGGGVVLIYAVGDVSIGTSGFILANGGRGGDGDLTAGPGGGGGGGSVQIFSGGSINILNTNGVGASQARSGSGGTNGIAAVGANGAGGRSWFSAVSYTMTGTYTPTEAAGFTRGNVEYNDSTEFVDTKSVDLLTSGHKIIDFYLSPTHSDFTIQLAGSDDDFVMDDTGFTNDPTVVSNKRYIKMEITITTSNVNAPTMIDAAIVDVDTVNTIALQSFQFQSAGCGRVEDVQTPKTNLFLFLLTPLLLLILKLKAQRQLARDRRRISA